MLLLLLLTSEAAAEAASEAAQKQQRQQHQNLFCQFIHLNIRSADWSPKMQNQQPPKQNVSETNTNRPYKPPVQTTHVSETNTKNQHKCLKTKCFAEGGSPSNRNEIVKSRSSGEWSWIKLEEKFENNRIENWML